MKKSEEIDSLAEKEFPKNHIDKYTSYNDNSFRRQGFKSGYIKCQEDNIERKYTDKDLTNFYYRAGRIGVENALKEFKYLNSLSIDTDVIFP